MSIAERHSCPYTWQYMRACMRLLQLHSGALRRDTGGLQNLTDVLKALHKSSTGSTAAGKDLRIILLTVLLAMAVDEASRAACLTAGLIPLLIQMLQSIRDDQVYHLCASPQSGCQACLLLPCSDLGQSNFAGKVCFK